MAGVKGQGKKKIPLTECEKIEKMASVGLAVDQIAALLNVSKRTFERRMKEEPAILDALEKGRARATFKVANRAYKMAESGHCPAMTMFWLKCRAGWKETRGVEHSGSLGGVLQLSTLSEEDAQTKAEQILNRLKAG